MRELVRDELRWIYDQAYYDRERAERVSTVESNLLDLDKGEVLSQSLRYNRQFRLPG